MAVVADVAIFHGHGGHDVACHCRASDAVNMSLWSRTSVVGRLQGGSAVSAMLANAAASSTSGQPWC